MKNLFVFILLFQGYFLTAQHDADFYGKEAVVFNGNVETVLVEYFKPEIQKDSTTKLVYQKSAFSGHHNKLYFDKSKKLIKKEEFVNTCGTAKTCLRSYIIYQYKKDQLQSETEYTVDKDLLKSRGEKPQATSFEYYKNEVNIHCDFYSSYGDKKITKEGDTETEVTTKSFHVRKKVRTFDSLNRPIKYEFSQGDQLRNVEEYFYADDEQNQPIAVDLSRPKSDKIVRHKMKYNEHGDMIYFGVFYKNGSMLNETVMEYDYDNENNWIEKRLVNSKGDVWTVVKRKIKYFE